MKVVIASDHAGFSLKEDLVLFIRELGHEVEDLGPDSTVSVDYPDFAGRVGEAISLQQAQRGVLICGSGIGMSMAANKFEKVRAALVGTPELARLSRQHNDANVLCLGERFLTKELAREIVRVWFETAFEGGRHQERVNKMNRLGQPSG